MTALTTPQITDRPEVGEKNGLVDGIGYHDARNQNGRPETVSWTTKGLKITRLRLLSDPGYPYWDVSYCHGVLNGKDVNVELPFSYLPKRNMMKAIVEYGKKDKVFAKATGIFGAISTLN